MMGHSVLNQHPVPHGRSHSEDVQHTLILDFLDTRGNCDHSKGSWEEQKCFYLIDKGVSISLPLTQITLQYMVLEAE